MASVELAIGREGRGHRVYALKRPHKDLWDDPRFRSMYLDESRLARLIKHPNVVPVLEVATDEQSAFLVMEYVDGVPLAEIVSTASERGDPLPVSVCLRIAADVANGLHAAHELTSEHGEPLGLVHRDVSPQNVIVGFDGASRVTDFGIAKAAGNQASTSTGTLKGRIGYMAPEYLRFEAIDRRADVFSLGVVVYEMLAGERLYAGDDAHQVAGRILNEPPPDLGSVRMDLPPGLVDLVMRMLAKEREHRPATCGQVARQLEELERELAPYQRPVDVATYMEEVFGDTRRRRAEEIAAAVRRSRSARRRRWAVASTVLASALVAGGLGWRGGVVERCAAPGLQAEYFAGTDLRDLKLTRVDPKIHFNWGFAPPDPRLSNEHFSVRWTGMLAPVHSERADLCVRADDGVRLWFDGRLIVDKWTHQTARNHCAPVDLVAGRWYPLKVEYFQGTVDAVIDLLWSSPRLGNLVIVPPSQICRSPQSR